MHKDGVYNQSSWISRLVKQIFIFRGNGGRIPGHIAIFLHQLKIKPRLKKMCFSQGMFVFDKRIFTLLVIIKKDVDAPNVIPLTGPCTRIQLNIPVENGFWSSTLSHVV